MKKTLLNAPLGLGSVPTAAWTRADLLAVIAILGILTVVQLPGLDNGRVTSQADTCLNNLRKLSMAWNQYAVDHNDQLPNNPSSSSTSGSAWVGGWLNFSSQADNTNVLLLLEPRYAQLGPYTKDPQLYKCPADQSQVVIAGRKIARVRSYSMNGALGSSDYIWITPPYKLFMKLSDIANPPPDRLFVFVDEHPDSINDGYFALSMPSTTNSMTMVDFPAYHHNQAGAVSFADGHAELHLWQDARTMPPMRYNGSLTLNVTQPNNPDIIWLTSRTTAK